MRGARVLFGFVIAALAVSLSLTAVGGAAATVGTAALPAGAAPSYNAEFGETGLPAGTNWSVHVAFIGCGCTGVHTTVSSVTSSIGIALPNGSYRYNILRVPGYVVVGIAHGIVNVTGAAPPPVDVTFTALVTFPVEFTESGLPGGTSWTVHVTGNGVGQIRAFEDVTTTSASSSIEFSLPNATYHYTVSPVNGSFFNGPSHGTFAVAGPFPTPILVTFVTPETFSVSFDETGLVTGLIWTVAVQGQGLVPVHETRSSHGTATIFYLPNGTYHYRLGEILGYDISGPSTATFTVADASSVIDVSFVQLGSAALYLVDFNESGLASGTQWSVHVAAVHTFGRGSKATGSSTGSTDSFALQNGTYRYHVLPVRGYTLRTGPGMVTVAGAAAPVVLVTFTAIPTYTVTFNETGLPNGTAWSVLVRSQSAGSTLWPIHLIEKSNSTAVSFVVPNGTYCYRIYPVHGFRITTGSATGSFVVDGASPAIVYVVYSAAR